ncbi:MbtH family protein [Candidatus Protochlamydia sp. W-9]|uniref:MbtH family protein n=1 Tax=Candidatus Protochlamydia sp. W-9 TaxID=1785087 RepID=UPI00096A7D2E|nr:MbtH family NRPS accessory protein [Candidatus Protochlamydia sp. W-9]
MHQQEQVELQYEVVINEEEQYSIWPVTKEIPAGWKAVGQKGNKAVCLSYIKCVWTDMRPLSLRKQMENLKTVNMENLETAENVEVEDFQTTSISSTVKFLSTGLHPLSVYPSPVSIEHFKAFLEEQFIHINYLDTKGETCLGVNLDLNSTDKWTIGFEQKKGTFHLEGDLILDYVKVRCVADVDLSSMKGMGYLRILES